jgi:hypothetical protein
VFLQLELEDQVSPLLQTPTKARRVNKFAKKNTAEDKRNRVERVSFTVEALEGVGQKGA